MNKYISVIIPVFNSENTIIKTLSSLEQQSFKNFEVIIVNDGSTDSSEKIINEYIKNKSNFIQIYKNNSGVSDTRNVGLSVASGNYVTFVDSDDFVEYDYFENFAKDCEDNDLIIYGYIQNSSSGKENIMFDDVMNFSNKKELYESLSKKNMFNIVWNKFFKRDLINNIKFDISFDIGEDMDFVIKFISQNECKNIKIMNKCFYNYILSSNGLGFKKRNDTFLTKYKIYNNLVSFYDKNCFSREYVDLILFKTYLFGFITLKNTKKLNKNTMIDYIDKCNEIINFSNSKISRKYKILNYFFDIKIYFLVVLITNFIDFFIFITKKIKFGL